MYVDVPQVCAWYQRTQKKVTFPLKMELQTVVSWYVGAWKRIWVLWKSNKSS